MRAKRSLGRRAQDAIDYLLSAVESKHGKKRGRGLSAFRLVVLGSWIQFARNWPVGPWGLWDWAALATILCVMPIADLFAAAPVIEGLQTLAAIFGGIISKRVTRTETASTYTSEGSPPLEPLPPDDGAVG